jgi:superfamily I DNA/RNA helicase
MNSGTIKISTINSFKGWESEVLFILLERKYSNINDFNVSFDELLYTGLTRCRSNLVIINFGNEEYHRKIKPLIDKVK